MKNKLWLACFALVLTFQTRAQAVVRVLEKIRFGFGGGFVSASPHLGLSTYLEPSYNITDVFTVGARAEWLMLTYGLPDDRMYETLFRGTYSLNGKYYLRTRKFRPFVGVGVGSYGLSPVRYHEVGEKTGLFSGGTEITEAERKIGLYPRVGFDLWNFTISVDYNFIPNSKVIEPGSGAHVRNNYLGIHFGANLGLPIPKHLRRSSD